MQSQYDISKTYNSFGGGISDDDFVGTQNAVLDLENIELQVNERYAKPSQSYGLNATYSTFGGNPTWVKETPNGGFRGNSTEVQNFTGVQLSGTIGTVIDGMESYGSSTDQINYFFNRTTGGIKKTNYIGTTLLATITSGYPTGINSTVTAIGWHVTNLLFSKLNIIYFLSTVTDTCATAVTLMPGSVVKKIYSYSFDSTIVIATSGNSTFIYELEFTGGAYNIVSKIEVKGYVCTSAVGNETTLWWGHQYGISQYQGRQNQHVKYNILLGDPLVGYDRQLIASSGGNLHKFGHIKPGRSNILTKYVGNTSQTLLAIDGSTILYGNGSTSSLALLNSTYQRTNIIDLLPFDGGNVGVPKSDLNFRFGYIFDRDAYVSPTVRQEIEVQIQTVESKLNNPSMWITVGSVIDGTTLDSIGNPKCGYMIITSANIADALRLANFSEQSGYFNIRILLKAGDQYTSTQYFLAPAIFDFTINANYVKR